jgi:hypothetical protein
MAEAFAVVAKVAPEALKVRAHIPQQALHGGVAEVHVRDRRNVDVCPLELADGGSKHAALLARGPLLGHLKDGVAHAIDGRAEGVRPPFGEPAQTYESRMDLPGFE